jgi:hypothetical protein
MGKKNGYASTNLIDTHPVYFFTISADETPLPVNIYPANYPFENSLTILRYLADTIGPRFEGIKYGPGFANVNVFFQVNREIRGSDTQRVWILT